MPEFTPTPEYYYARHKEVAGRVKEAEANLYPAHKRYFESYFDLLTFRGHPFEGIEEATKHEEDRQKLKKAEDQLSSEHRSYQVNLREAYAHYAQNTEAYHGKAKLEMDEYLRTSAEGERG